MSKRKTPADEPLLPLADSLMVRDTCLCLHAQRAARRLARRFDEAFRPLGITSGQFSLLMALNRPGGGPARLAEAVSVLAMDRTTVTANLKPLERGGLVEVGIDPADRRGRLLTLTAAGHALLRAALPVWQRTHATIDRPLGPGGATRLRADLLAVA